MHFQVYDSIASVVRQAFPGHCLRHLNHPLAEEISSTLSQTDASVDTSKSVRLKTDSRAETMSFLRFQYYMLPVIFYFILLYFLCYSFVGVLHHSSSLTV